MHKFNMVLAMAVLLFFGCSSPNVNKTVNHQLLFIKGGTNNKLEVLDWGGTGAPILFLAGLGDAAHVSDDFAPRFTNKFHVYGLTRRGFGASDQPATGYSVTTLANDILAVIDSLQLKKVILIGHSIAGEEISKFASSNPDKVSKVVYLDAAYDRTTPYFKQVMAITVQTPKPTALDSSSFAQWKAFNTRILGVPFPDDDFKQTAVFSKTGKYLHDVTPDSVYAALIKGVQHPDYKHITCPALALYAKYNSAKEVIPSYAELDTVNKKKANEQLILMQKYSIAEQDRFKSQVRYGTIKVIEDANHYIFISNPVETEKMIRDFLE